MINLGLDEVRQYPEASKYIAQKEALEFPVLNQNVSANEDTKLFRPARPKRLTTDMQFKMPKKYSRSKGRGGSKVAVGGNRQQRRRSKATSVRRKPPLCLFAQMLHVADRLSGCVQMCLQTYLLIMIKMCWTNECCSIAI